MQLCSGLWESHRQGDQWSQSGRRFQIHDLERDDHRRLRDNADQTYTTADATEYKGEAVGRVR